MTKQEAIRIIEDVLDGKVVHSTALFRLIDWIRGPMTEAEPCGFVNEDPPLGEENPPNMEPRGGDAPAHEGTRAHTREGILQNAIQCVTKDRNATHGEPEDNFQNIANYWETYLESIGVYKGYYDEGGSRNLNGVDVAAMMTLMKIARIASSPQHLDHWTDGAGYLACGGEIACKEIAPCNVGCEPIHYGERVG